MHMSAHVSDGKNLSPTVVEDGVRQCECGRASHLAQDDLPSTDPLYRFKQRLTLNGGSMGSLPPSHE